MIVGAGLAVVRVAVVASSEEFDENTVTPGVIGFIAMALIAVVTILLLLDMTRRIRRTRYRGEIGERLDAEHGAATAADPAPPFLADDDSPGEGRTGDPRPPERR